MSCKIHSESEIKQLERNWPEGIKKTKQRIAIYKILSDADAPLSAAEIFQLLNERKEQLPYAFSTVYRCLLAFETAGILSKSVLISEETAVYELRIGVHRHYAICLTCHKRFPLRACLLGDMRRMLGPDTSGFEITGHQLEIYGYCSTCQSDI